MRNVMQIKYITTLTLGFCIVALLSSCLGTGGAMLPDTHLKKLESQYYVERGFVEQAIGCYKIQFPRIIQDIGLIDEIRKNLLGVRSPVDIKIKDNRSKQPSRLQNVPLFEFVEGPSGKPRYIPDKIDIKKDGTKNMEFWVAPFKFYHIDNKTFWSFECDYDCGVHAYYLYDGLEYKFRLAIKSNLNIRQKDIKAMLGSVKKK